MKTVKQQEKIIFLAAPLVLLMSMALVFHSLGGGTAAAGTDLKRPNRVNTLVPPPSDVRVNDKKTSMKEKHIRDLRRREQVENDPYAQRAGLVADKGIELGFISTLKGVNDIPVHPTDTLDPNAIQEMQKRNSELLQQIQAMESAASKAPRRSSKPRRPAKQPEPTPELPPTTEPNPTSLEDDLEMQGINAMLSKILDIQHPDRVRERMRAESMENREGVYSVETVSGMQQRSQLGYNEEQVLQTRMKQLLGEGFDRDDYQNIEAESVLTGFHGPNRATESSVSRAVSAVVHSEQKVAQSDRVCIRLNETLYISGETVPAGTLIYGEAKISNARLFIYISNIHYRQKILPVALTAYDLDGNEGLNVPASVTRQEAKRSAATSSNTLGTLGGLGPTTLEGAAVTEGVRGIRSLTQRAAQQITVLAKDTHQILLVDRTRKNQ